MDKVQKWRVNCKQRMVDSMGGKCAICGYSKCNSALEFHHIDPATKSFELKTALERPKAWSSIVEELKKCVLLCSNCHRELHSGLVSVESKQYFNEDYTNYKGGQIKLTNECPVCKAQKSIRQKTCSNKCAGSLARKVDWDKIDLPTMLKEYGNAEQVGKQLDVSGAAVRKQLNKLHTLNVPATEIYTLTLEECKNKFPLLVIDNESLGIDRGVLFNTIGVKVDSYNGRYRVAEYLPSPDTGSKSVDFFIVIIDC